MNQMDNIRQAAPSALAADDEGVVDLLITLAKNKALIIRMALAAAVLSAAVSFVLPNAYKASAKLLPPQQSQSGASAVLAQLGGMAGVAANVAGLKNSSDLYVGMLKSRTVADRLVKKFDLKKVYETDTLEKTRKKLEDNTVVSTGKDGLITVEVEDRNKKLVAPLTNAYIDELKKLTQVLAVTEAAQRRLFFEQQLEAAKNNLTNAEIALKRQFETKGVISVDGDSRAIVETIGRLRAQVSAKEIQLNSMRSFVTPSNPEFRRAEEELFSLKSELSKLENGRDAQNDKTKTAGDSTGGFESIKTLRDVKYYQMLYELLAKQYEAARLDEAKDSSVVQVLDEAVEPEREFKPKRAIIIVIATIIGAVFGVALAFLFEAKTRILSSSAGAIRWAELKANLSVRTAK